MKNLKSFIIRYWWPLTITSTLVLLAIQIYAQCRNAPFTSDGVVVQNLAYYWSHGQHSITETGPDTFILKIPIYWLLQLLPTSRKVLFATVLGFNLVGFGLFALAIKTWIGKNLNFKKAINKLALVLPLLWFVTQDHGFIFQLINPNTRNIEIGVVFIILAWLLRRLDRPIRLQRDWWRLGLIAAASGLIMAHDPYFLYFVFAPLALAFAVSMIWNRNIKPLAWGLGFVLASLVIYKIAGVALSHWGITIYAVPQTVISSAALGSHVSLMLQQLLQIFGANIFGQPILALHMVRIGLSLLLLAAAGIQAIRMLVAAHHQRDLRRLYPALAFVFVPLSLALVSFPDPSIPGRYLVILPFLAVILLGYAILDATGRLRQILLGLVLALIAANGFSLLHFAHKKPVIIGAYPTVTAQSVGGLHDGYAEYWVAGINTYLDRGQVNINPVSCEAGQLVYMSWYHDRYAVDHASTQTFAVYSQALIDEGCNPENAATQFGPSTRQTQLSSGETVLYYDYNIGTRLSVWTQDITRL